MSETLTKKGVYQFMAEPFHCDFQNQILMGHLGNHLLNAADFHATARGFGMTYLHSIGKTWVLSRLSMEMQRMPQAYTKFNVHTWIESAMRYFTNRNFMVEDCDTGEVYGYGKSIWAMIDIDTRQPVNLLDINDGALEKFVDKDTPCPIAKSSRVRMETDLPVMARTTARYNDIDINGHVNSIKYIEHLLDLFDMEWYRQHHLQRFEIAYVAEGHCGDELTFQKQENDNNDFSVRVTAQHGDEATELCRCRMIFTDKEAKE